MNICSISSFRILANWSHPSLSHTQQRSIKWPSWHIQTCSPWHCRPTMHSGPFNICGVCAKSFTEARSLCLVLPYKVYFTLVKFRHKTYLLRTWLATLGFHPSLPFLALENTSHHIICSSSLKLTQMDLETCASFPDAKDSFGVWMQCWGPWQEVGFWQAVHENGLLLFSAATFLWLFLQPLKTCTLLCLCLLLRQPG